MVPEPITMTNYWSSSEKKRLLAGAQDWPDSLDRVRAQYFEAGEQHPLNQVLHVYCQDWLVEDLLMKADKMSMANSLELRTPFLDYRLVEWAAALPARLKAGRTNGGPYRTKEILRRYATTRLPASIVNRPKQGFPVPVYGWLSGSLASWATDTLLSQQSHVRAWFHPAELNEVLSAGTSATADTMKKHRLWNLLILEIWMQKWLP
jgi:asparagine synthase (glutamine-hydrolysing)